MKPLTAEEIAELRRPMLDGVRFALGLNMPLSSEGAALAQKAIAALPRLLDEVERSRALLKRIEWEGWATGTEGLCPECLGHGTHADDCELAALLQP